VAGDGVQRSLGLTVAHLPVVAEVDESVVPVAPLPDSVNVQAVFP
jgi:hypothetical protein